MSLDTRRIRHESAFACVDGATGARTTKSAALSRHDDSPRLGARLASPASALTGAGAYGVFTGIPVA